MLVFGQLLMIKQWFADDFDVCIEISGCRLTIIVDGGQFINTEYLYFLSAGSMKHTGQRRFAIMQVMLLLRCW